MDGNIKMEIMFTGSKKKLLELIKRNGILSIDQAVGMTDLAKTTLREHLLQLELDGYVERDYIRSGQGRPSLQYRMTQKGNSLFPTSESILIRELLKFLKSRGEEEVIEGFFRVFWEERLKKARDLISRVSQENTKTRIEKLTQMLEDEGFMPEFSFDEEKERFTIKECNCPFSEVIKETQLPCKLEAMFYKKLLSEKAERSTHIAKGDYSCTYEIPE
jgi:predicted ArsR family transcriptional regulator